MAEILSEAAPAKVNLTLHVTGQRRDGYHLLQSLVVFPEIADRLEACKSDMLSLEITGPFAKGLNAGPDNLIMRAAKLIAPGRGAAITLEKNLPVAAGIGGGSADAAAALRLLSRLWDLPLPAPADTLTLGADVPVCLASGPVLMQGVGEQLTPVQALPRCGIILINPRAALGTPAVFNGLKCKMNSEMTPIPPSMNDVTQLTEWLARQRNDLQDPAIEMVPEIATVLGALSQSDKCMLARMSGSGATCFGLYASKENAEDACFELMKHYPDWWIVSSEI